MLEHNSAIEKAVDWIIMADINQPHTAPPVPEYPRA